LRRLAEKGDIGPFKATEFRNARGGRSRLYKANKRRVLNIGDEEIGQALKGDST